jgi:hypothetical protein
LFQDLQRRRCAAISACGCLRNITPPPLPPRCPELNPVENVWQFRRDNWLPNHNFKYYDDIVDHCCFAWNKSSNSLGASCPSERANGLMSSNQCTLA